MLISFSLFSLASLLRQICSTPTARKTKKLMESYSECSSQMDLSLFPKNEKNKGNSLFYSCLMLTLYFLFFALIATAHVAATIAAAATMTSVALPNSGIVGDEEADVDDEGVALAEGLEESER